MTCPECEKWEQQARTNYQTVLLQTEVINGLRVAIREIVHALKHENTKGS